MPTYEYECTKCGGEFEFFHSISEGPKTTCEVCGGELKKLLSAGSGLIFKGSGFYITDYKNKPAEGREKKKGVDEKSGGDAKGSESKPAEAKSGGESGKSESSPATPSKSSDSKEK